MVILNYFYDITQKGGVLMPKIIQKPALTVAGDSLQIDSGLPSASVNILMALVLLAVFGWVGGGRQGLFVKRGAA
jgi:hypothetical protein